jgi:hypothetical protein
LCGRGKRRVTGKRARHELRSKNHDETGDNGHETTTLNEKLAGRDSTGPKGWMTKFGIGVRRGWKRMRERKEEGVREGEREKRKGRKGESLVREKES